MWPWGACWLQEGWQTADLDAHKKPLMCGLEEKPLMYGPGVPVGCKRAEGWQTADLDAHKKPLMCGLGEKPLMYGPGVPVGCKRAGKRQTWMPIRSH